MTHAKKDPYEEDIYMLEKLIYISMFIDNELIDTANELYVLAYN